MASATSTNILHPRPPDAHSDASSQPDPTLAGISRALIPFTPIFIPPAADKAQPAAVRGDGAGWDAGESEAKKVVEISGGGGREHKKRSKNWSRSETLALIRLRRELAHRFAKSGRKSELWDEIADTLHHNHFSRDAQQCRDKWEKLMASYKEVRDGLKHPDDNPYYDELHPLLCHRQPKRERERERDSSSHTQHELAPPTLHTPPKPQAIDPLPTLPMPSEAQYPSPLQRPPAGSNGQQQQQQQPSLRPSSAPDPRHRHMHRNRTQKPPRKRSANLAIDNDDDEDEDDSAGSDEEDCDDDEGEEEVEEEQEQNRPWKKMRRAASKLGDMQAVQALLESIISRQQRFFEELLSDMERKEEAREQMRQKREEKWREEERAQRVKLTEAMRILTQEILGVGGGGGGEQRTDERLNQVVVVQQQQQQQQQEQEEGTLKASPLVALEGQPKRRSKNWKRTEVLQLIRLRGEMEEKFVSSSRRAALWNELAASLAGLGIRRDGKQCREKWDKLMAEYKEVLDGKKEKSDSSYFPELQAALRPREAA